MKFRRGKKQEPRTRVTNDADISNRAQMFSYHAQRSQLSGERKQPNEGVKQTSSKAALLHQIPIIVAILIVIAAIGYSLTLSSKPKVVILGDSTSRILRGDETVYQKLMQEKFKKSIFYKSKLTLDTNKLTRELKREYPEFSGLAVVIPLVGRRPIIQVKPATPVFVLKNSKGAFLIDQEGKAVLELQSGTELPKEIPVVIDQAGVDVAVGQAVLPKQSLSFMNDILGQFKGKNMAIESMTLPALANELHVKLAGQPYFIKFNMEGDGRQQVGTFLALQQKLSSDRTTPGEYVDVRVDEKAFYR